ncbi:LacI family DNA-binding transcriptional regulator [Aeromonas rivipollensis]
MANITDVSRLANVSKATVSRVLSARAACVKRVGWPCCKPPSS